MVDRAAQGQTVFLSSHQIVEVERVADIVTILRRGKLLLVEPLDELKAQVRRLTVTLKDGAACGAGIPPALFCAGETPASQLTAGETPAPQVLSERWKARQWQAVVRGMTDEQMANLRRHETVDGVEVHPASLEDIFVAYMQDKTAGS